MTREHAITLADSYWWAGVEPRRVAEFQLQEPLLCMPFDLFQMAVESALGRPVWTHEFAQPQRLIDELYGTQPRPSLEDILDLIPADKRVLLIAE